MTDESSKRQLGARLTFSGIAIPLLFLAIYFSAVPWFHWIFVFLVGAIISGALWEFYRISSSKGLRPVFLIGILTTFAFSYALYGAVMLPSLYFAPSAVLFIALLSLFGYFLSHQAAPLLNMGATVLGIGYLTLPLSGFIIINYFFSADQTQDGRWWLVYLLVVTKMNDAAAYFVGKLWGRTPLAPKISPKKTIEGALGGLLISVLVSLLFYFCMHKFSSQPPLQMNLWQSVWISLVLGFLAQFGDLSESLFKRDTGVKDSNQLPGLGGMLDMVDSLVFTTPFFTLFLQIQFG